MSVAVGNFLVGLAGLFPLGVGVFLCTAWVASWLPANRAEMLRVGPRVWAAGALLALAFTGLGGFLVYSGATGQAVQTPTPTETSDGN